VLGFVALILFVVVLIHFYLWKRLVRDTLRPGKWRRAGGVVALLLTILIPATLIGVRSGHVQWLAWPGYLWLALMFYLLVALIVIEIPRLAIALWLRHTAITKNQQNITKIPMAESKIPSAAAGAEPAGESPATGSAATEPTRPAPDPAMKAKTARDTEAAAKPTAPVQIPLPKLPRSLDGTRFAVVSDIHLGPLTGSHHVPRIVAMINDLNADVVCIVGDLVDGTVQELGRFAEPLANIRSKQGAYFVTGNHEYYSGFQPWIDEVTKLNVRPLRNERLELSGGALDLAGVNDLGGEQYGDGPDFGKALGDRDPTRPVILLAHQPVVAHQAAKYGVDLQLSGHTHGGQMAPFNLLVKLQQPVVSGLGKVDGVPVYVTNGAGFWGPPVRVGAPPQVTMVELRAP
jgi:predicted MPP superfamily phosphohydrolase